MREGKSVLEKCSGRLTEIARCLKMVARVYTEMGSYPSAFVVVEEALEVAKCTNDKHLLPDMLLVSARVLLKLD